MKFTKVVIATIGLALASTAFAGGGKPSKPKDPIGDFLKSWEGKALAHQRDLDRYSPMKDNNILGSHNTYNSEKYRNAVRYLDPQQKFSIYDQLRIGARFIELDAHYTSHNHGWPWQWGTDLLLCHSGIGKSVGNLHIGCSLQDRFLKDGINEVKDWLNKSENKNEVIILYIEDHTDGKHGKLYDVINSRIGNKIYKSGGCKAIPDTLTKDKVLKAGKQVVLWKDSGCSSHGSLKNTAFTSLGNIGRIWEDGTTIGAIAGLFNGGVKKISAGDVVTAFKTGGNIVNFDDLTYNDGRMKAGVWSWDVGEPNNWGGNQDCAVQWGNGRWDDANCGSKHAYACRKGNNWFVTSVKGGWTGGNNACANLGSGWVFDVPTNSQANEKLKMAKQQAGKSHVWLNYNDRSSEGKWKTRLH